MKTFEFNSAVCTYREQSERLLALGLKKETADMMYITDGRVPEEYRHYDLVPEYYESCLEDMVHIPAWSLDRLIHISKGKRGIVILRVGENNFDVLIKRIEYLIKQGTFNKDYLEERK